MESVIKKVNFNLITSLLTSTLGALVIAILSQVSISLPNGVPITLQTFAVALVGLYLGRNKGIQSICIYLFLGVIGVPVFALGNSGPIVLFGLTGGFLMGFIFFVLFCGMSKDVKNSILKVILCLIGLLICHICGVLQYSLLTKNSFITSVALVSVPFLLKDVMSVFLAILTNKVIKK